MASKFLLLHFISIMFLVSYTFATERDRPIKSAVNSAVSGSGKQ